MISIVVPVYNCEKHVTKCIDSLRAQTYKDIEIIIVDDGSTDNSLEKCKKLALEDDRIVVFTKSNGGASSARNFGINKAKGTYVMFADSDDYADPEWCEVMLEAQIQNEKSFCICDIFKHQVDENSDVILKDVPVKSDIYEMGDFYLVLAQKVLNQPYNKIYSIELLKKNNVFFNEDMPIGEDLLFNLNYINYCNNMYVMERKLYHYLENNTNSLCHRYHKNLYKINALIFKKKRELLERFGTFNRYENVYFSNVLSGCIDCLDRELTHNESALTGRLKNMKKVFKSDSYMECLKKCKNQIRLNQYLILRSKSPILYMLYSNLSKVKRKKVI